MDILTEVTQLKEANAQLETNHNAATESLAAALGELNTFKAEAEAGKATIATQLEQINDLTSKLTASGNELGSVRAELETLKANQQTAEQKAVTIVASQGVAPMLVKAGASEAVSQSEAIEQYKSKLASGDSIGAAKYFAQYKSVILGK